MPILVTRPSLFPTILRAAIAAIAIIIPQIIATIAITNGAISAIIIRNGRVHFGGPAARPLLAPWFRVPEILDDDACVAQRVEGLVASAASQLGS
jgi:hypothetical protein